MTYITKCRYDCARSGHCKSVFPKQIEKEAGKTENAEGNDIIKQDTERDNYMSAEEAVEYGLIDKVISKR